jgi:hypothetical protein
MNTCKYICRIVSVSTRERSFGVDGREQLNYFWLSNKITGPFLTILLFAIDVGPDATEYGVLAGKEPRAPIHPGMIMMVIEDGDDAVAARDQRQASIDHGPHGAAHPQAFGAQFASLHHLPSSPTSTLIVLRI